MEELLTVAEILTATGIARATLYRMLDEGLPYKQVGARKKLFSLEEVKEFIGKRKNDLISKLEIGKEYYNDELCTIFKCSTQGGMRRSHSTGALVLISHHDDPGNAYLDYWQGDIFYYTGMGMDGDQDIDYAQNKTLRDSSNNGVIVYLFEVFSSQKYTYRGIVKLVGEPFQKDEIDFSGNLRSVWKFPLQLVQKSFINKEFVDREQGYIDHAAKEISNGQLRKKVKNVDGIARSRITKTITYEYNSYVREYAKRRANGRCELCGNDAPFSIEGRPFLKTYHFKPLSKGGRDDIQNIAALCPNCYEKVLYLKADNDLEKIKRQIDEDEELFLKLE